jgi:hypothetical protein
MFPRVADKRAARHATNARPTISSCHPPSSPTRDGKRWEAHLGRSDGVIEVIAAAVRS